MPMVLPAVAETTNLSVHFAINSVRELFGYAVIHQMCSMNITKHKTVQKLCDMNKYLSY